MAVVSNGSAVLGLGNIGPAAKAAIPALEAATKDSNGHADLERQEQLGLIRRALGELRNEEQEVFLLRQNGELTYEEIARTLDIPVNTAKTRMRLALTKLRTALGPD